MKTNAFQQSAAFEFPFPTLAACGRPPLLVMPQ